jgi:hypothetical protein
MMLGKNWWRRRRVANDVVTRTVVLDFFSVALESVCEHGTYYVERVGGDWEARYRAKDARPDARDTRIDARVDGDPADWPCRGRAEDACVLHAELLALGYSVVRATELVAARSDRVAQHQRVDTIDYAAPVAAQR